MRVSLPKLDWIDVDETLARVRPVDATGRVLLFAGACLALAGVWWLVWSTGGTRGPYLHTAYLPILFTGATLGVHAALATALLTTIVLGPLMPLDVAASVEQHAFAWSFRGAFFVAVGTFVGAGFSVVRARSARNEELRNNLASIYSRNLRVFAGLVEGRDEQTYGHCDRVGRNAVAIGRRMGLDARELGRLYWAGLLHDLGKIGVPEAILRKPGALTDEERRQMHKHCELGRTILLNVSQDFGPIAEGVLSHHERWDGDGYPHGLRGEDIPLFGRIVAVADVFEALTSHRPYRDPMCQAEALALLVEGRGRHFDPRVHDAFVAALASDEIGHEGEDPRATRAFVHGILRPDTIGLDLIGDDASWQGRAPN